MCMFLTVFAAGGSLIDIDATIFIQFGIFIVLFFVLRAVLFAPMMRLLEARRTATDGTCQAAAQLEAQAAQMNDSVTQRLAEARADAVVLRAKAVEESRRQSAEIIRVAKESCAASVEAARAEHLREAQGVRISLDADVDSLANAITAQMLGRSI